MNTSAKKIIKIGSLSVFFLFIIVYAILRSKDLILGVRITNVNIVDGTKVTDNILKVSGVARNAVDLKLDGREISVDQVGNFSETIALLPGYNVVDIVAKDKFGNTDEKNYKLIYQKE